MSTNREKKQSLALLCPAGELIHGVVDAERVADDGLRLHGEDGLEDDKVLEPPGQDHDLGVGEDALHTAGGDVLRLQDGDHLGKSTFF